MIADNYIKKTNKLSAEPEQCGYRDKNNSHNGAYIKDER
jgi:hypothetical protein